MVRASQAGHATGLFFARINPGFASRRNVLNVGAHLACDRPGGHKVRPYSSIFIFPLYLSLSSEPRRERGKIKIPALRPSDPPASTICHPPTGLPAFWLTGLPPSAFRLSGFPAHRPSAIRLSGFLAFRLRPTLVVRRQRVGKPDSGSLSGGRRSDILRSSRPASGQFLHTTTQASEDRLFCRAGAAVAWHPNYRSAVEPSGPLASSTD